MKTKSAPIKAIEVPIKPSRIRVAHKNRTDDKTTVKKNKPPPNPDWPAFAETPWLMNATNRPPKAIRVVQRPEWRTEKDGGIPRITTNKKQAVTAIGRVRPFIFNHSLALPVATVKPTPRIADTDAKAASNSKLATPTRRLMISDKLKTIEQATPQITMATKTRRTDVLHHASICTKKSPSTTPSEIGNKTKVDKNMFTPTRVIAHRNTSEATWPSGNKQKTASNRLRRVVSSKVIVRGESTFLDYPQTVTKSHIESYDRQSVRAEPGV